MLVHTQFTDIDKEGSAPGDADSPGEGGEYRMEGKETGTRYVKRPRRCNTFAPSERSLSLGILDQDPVSILFAGLILWFIAYDGALCFE